MTTFSKTPDFTSPQKKKNPLKPWGRFSVSILKSIESFLAISDLWEKRDQHNWLMHEQGWISETWQTPSQVLRNYGAIRTNALHAITRMPMFAASTLPPRESRSARALSSPGVTGDGQGAVRITLTLLAGASWSSRVSRVARRTPRHCRYKRRFGQARHAAYSVEHLARCWTK